MSEHADYLYALDLQKQWEAQESTDEEADIQVAFKSAAPPKRQSSVKPPLKPKRSNPHSNLDKDFLDRTQNLVHPMWETLDPTPDIHALFTAFDGKFFQSRLKCVTLEWSKRMYSCAGICYSRRNRFGQDVTVRLSEPLLKLRPRKDLVETMLHEMIHAYCFVLHIREGNGGHGPNFKKIMYGINKVAGTNITVYHTFHDEVEMYKQHWWRCNGVCQHRSPFFGYVKRTCNRAPSANDQWWAAHQQSCGGTFMKIKGPEMDKNAKKAAKEAATKGKAQTKAGQDLRKFFPNVNQENNKPKGSAGGKNVPKPPAASNLHGFNGSIGGGLKGPVKSNGGGTMLLKPNNPILRAIESSASAFPPTSYPGLSTDPFNIKSPAGGGNRRATSLAGNLRNVVGLRDLNSSDEDGGGGGKSAGKPSMTGKGYSMTTTSNSWLGSLFGGGAAKNKDASLDREKLREVWSKRFAAGGGGGGSHSDGDSDGEAGKIKKEGGKRRRLSDGSDWPLEGREIAWVKVDDDIMLQETKPVVIALSSDDDDDDDDDEQDRTADRSTLGTVLEESSDDDNSDVMLLVPSFKQKKLTADERQYVIKREILDETVDLLDEDIVLIDDEYDDDNADDSLDLTVAAELADTSVIDEFFGDDTLLRTFKLENDVMPSGSRNRPKPEDDIITCPICQEKMKRSVLSEHLDGCTGIVVKIVPKLTSAGRFSTAKSKRKTWSGNVQQKAALPSITEAPPMSKRAALLAAGYSQEEVAKMNFSSTDEEEFVRGPIKSSSPDSPQSSLVELADDSFRSHRQRNIRKTTRQCPVCAQEIKESEMNDHLDECLLNR